MHRNSNRFRIFLAVAVLLSLTVGMVAAVPVTQSITYQGKLTDAAGNPLTGTYSVTFGLFDVASGDRALATDTHSVTATKGLFTTQITFDSGFYDGRALWLGIKIGADPEMFPRQELRPVPYALSLRPGATVAGSGTIPVLKLTKFDDGGMGLNITTTGFGSKGVYVVTKGQQSAAIHAIANGPQSNAIVGETSADGPAAVAGITTGKGSYGLYAKTTGGPNSDGVHALTTGPGSAGVYASTTGTGSNGIFAVTSGQQSPAFRAITSADTSSAVWGSTSGNGPNGSYNGPAAIVGTTTGTGSPGMFASTTGPYSSGVYATTDNYNSDGIDVTTNGQYSDGVHALTTAKRSPGINISTTGSFSSGVISLTTGSFSSGVISQTEGLSSNAVEATAMGGMGVDAYSSGSVGVSAASRMGTAIWADTYRDDHMYGVFTNDYMSAARYDTNAGDVAEYMPVSMDVTPGTVLVIGKEGKLGPSTNSYDTGVAGIVSTAPGMALGAREGGNPGEQLIAVAGRVPCKVDASNGPIHPRDLLTTSDNPGYAMKATDPKIGTVLGKAMGTLETGTGTIEVLVTLQ